MNATQDLPDKRPLSRSAIIGFCVVGLGLTGMAAAEIGSDAITIGDVDLTEVASILLLFVLLALVAERAVEIVLKVVCGPREVRIRRAGAMARARAEVTRDNEMRNLDAMESSTERLALLSQRSADVLNAMAEDVADAEVAQAGDLAEIKAFKTWFSVLLLCIIGGAISLSGLNVIAAFLASAGVTLEPQQANVLAFVDVITTTLLLGGASDAIHGLINRVVAR